MYAFYNCHQLTEIILPPSLTDINSNCFKNCSSLKYVEIGPLIHWLPDSIFENCISLTTVKFFSTSFNDFGNYSFLNCTSLKNLMFPYGACPKYWRENAFNNSGIHLPHECSYFLQSSIPYLQTKHFSFKEEFSPSSSDTSLLSSTAYFTPSPSATNKNNNDNGNSSGIGVIILVVFLILIIIAMTVFIYRRYAKHHFNYNGIIQGSKSQIDVLDKDAPYLNVDE